MEKITEVTVNAKTGQTEIIERELTEQEIAERAHNTMTFMLNEELNAIHGWLIEYDKQVAQYNRCQRLGEEKCKELGVEFDKDINELDNEATQKQLRIREIKNILKTN